jgi:glycosyltransferase involved in cell wall biosynthesis
MTAIRPTAVIPVFDHPATVGGMVRSVSDAGLHCIVVDDGSGAECARVLDDIAAEGGERVTLVRRPRNGGKGAAVLDGLARAQALGYTHVLQIDADGQHDSSDIPAFLALARQHPEAVILGRPVFDESIPRYRAAGRWVTHLLTWVHTLSFEIRDTMCGFRVYPIDAVLALDASAPLGRHMDFDIELLIRLHWRGLAFVSIPTRVRYPADGVSHYRMGRDNALVMYMHLRLFLGMIARLPWLLARKWRAA